MAMTESQNESLRAYAATNPSAEALAAAKQQYNVSDADYTNALAGGHRGIGDTYGGGITQPVNPNDITVLGGGGTPAPSTPVPSGIINGAINTAPASTSATGAAQATTTPWNVTADQTVQGRMAGLLDKNDPYNQALTTLGNEQANARGMVNASIGSSLVQDGIIKNAMGIAAPDAATAAKAAGYNADQTNQFATNNTAAQNQLNLANIAAGTQKYSTDVGANTSLSNAATTAATSKYNTDASAAAGLNSETNASLRQATASATSLLTSTQALNNAVMSNPAYPDTASKQAAILANNNTAKVGLQIIGAANNDIDIASYMDQLFPPA